MTGGLRWRGVTTLTFCSLIAYAAAATRVQRGLLGSSPFIPTKTLVSTTSSIITADNFLDTVIFAATVMSASPDVLLGPSSGAVEFTVGGSDAFAFVPSKVLGIANVTRVGVSGQASLTLEKSLVGITLLPGSYNVTATYSGSSNYLYTSSVGYTYFQIDVSSPPVIWGLGS